MEHAILPRMSSYRGLHHDYMRTHLHSLSTIIDVMCTIPCNPQTRQQSRVGAMANAAAAAAAAAAKAAATPAPDAGQGAQFVTATIDYHSLATTMSSINDDTVRNLKNGTQPKWDSKHESFVDWQHQVAILA